MNPFRGRFRDQVVIVTGGANGIGRCLVEAFRSEGAQAAVVNLSSTRAFQSQPDTESYTAAKGGITALTHALAVSLAGRVRVNAIAPGWIDTTGGAAAGSDADRKQHPAGRIGTPEDIAALALFLCGRESGFITGQCFIADGGMSRLMTYHGDAGWTYRPE